MFGDRLSLAQQVVSAIIKNIDTRIYETQFGNRLPPEKDLAKEFGVSRTTIRDAITQLISDGVVVRRPGIGTFINPPLRGSLRTWPYEKSSFLQLIRQAGHEPSMRLLKCSFEAVGDKASILNIESNDQVLVVEKIHFSDGIPVIHTWNAVPASYILPEHQDIIKQGYQCEESVYTFLKERCKREVAFHDSDIRAKECEEKIALLLSIESRTPVLQLEEVAYDNTQNSLFYGLSYLRSDVISFRIRRGLSLGL